MKERPILMSTENVKAILAGRKTQTRRVIKPCSTATLYDGSQPDWVYTLAKCPYGQVGDRLWVRETWRILDETTVLADMVRVEYKADGQIIKRRYGDINYNEWGIDLPVIDSAMHDHKWKPAHHLPHILSRITLEIAEIRVERLQEISEQDAYAEGCPSVIATIAEVPMVDWFNHLWDSLNPKHPFESNPWVWVISFKKV